MQANAFELEADLSGFTPYQRGGIVTQHKSPKQLAFKALQVASMHAVTPALQPCCPAHDRMSCAALSANLHASPADVLHN